MKKISEEKMIEMQIRKDIEESNQKFQAFLKKR